jgi:hypothetical protein
MNIFVLDQDPKLAAQAHLDKHVVKMIIEYAQLLSTAHRLRDGVLHERVQPMTGRKKKFYLLNGESVRLETRTDGGYMTLGDLEWIPEVTISEYKIVKPVCYSLSHQNHPCAVWCRESDSNYRWLYALFQETAVEYTHRYGRIHKTVADIGSFLMQPPKNIPAGDLTPFAQAMGEEFKVHDDAVLAYQNYYVGAKAPFARWTNRSTPSWFKARTKDFNVSHFERTSAVA